MTTKYHTPIEEKAQGYSYIVNRPLAQLDAAIAAADNLTDANGSLDLGVNDDFAKNHIILGAGHMRVDTNGNLRASDHAPQDDGDGTIVSTAPPPATGGDIVAAVSVSLLATVTSSTFNQFTSLIAPDDDTLIAGTYKLASGLPTSALIYSSVRPFTTWTLQQNLGQRAVYTLADLGGGVAMAGTSYLGWVFRSTDTGATWHAQQRLRTGSINNELRAMINLGNGVVMVGTSNVTANVTGYIWRSSDNGVTWAAKGRPASNTTQIFSFTRADNGRIIAGGTRSGGSGGTVYYSDDTGNTWTEVTSPFSGTRITALEKIPSGRLIAGDNSAQPRIYTSDDDGATWTFRQALSGGGSQCSDILSLGSARLLASTNNSGGKIYESTDSGVTWGAAIAVGSVNDVNQLARAGGNVYAACSNNELYTII